jgi:hypothetical protein
MESPVEPEDGGKPLKSTFEVNSDLTQALRRRLRDRRKITYRFWQDTDLDCHPVMYSKEVV